MNWKTGDQVRVLGETGKGVVVAVLENGQALVEMDGFEFPFPKDKLIPLTTVQKGDEPGVIPQKDPLSALITDQKKEVVDTDEVDLHLHAILSNERGLRDHEKLQIQLEHCEAAIREAKRKRRKYLIIIHGVGEGTLKMEVRKLLDRLGLEYDDASFQRFGRGATQVYFR